MVHTLSENLASWATSFNLKSVPEAILQRFSLHIIDAVGCAYAADRLEAFTNVSNIPTAVSSGAGIFGRDGLFSETDAAFANGVLIHALDFDDTHGPSVCHPTAVALAAAMAVAESREASDAEMFEACLAGVEVIARVGMARHNEFHLKGFHPTSVVGTIGATITAGKLMKLTAEEMTNALGISGSLACGIFAYLDGSSNPKPIHSGQGAKNGVEAARMAKAGVTGPQTLFESRFGLYGAFLGNPDSNLDALISTLGDVWESGNLSIKPYPACHVMHACLDCASDMRSSGDVKADNIEHIKISLTSDRDINLVLEPMAVKIKPGSDTVGRFSLPFSLSSMLIDGQVGLDTYEQDNLIRQDIRELAGKFSYEKRQFTTSGKALPGAVEITLKSGNKITRERLYERGGPDDRMTGEEIIEKFKINVGSKITTAAIDKLIAKLTNLSNSKGNFTTPKLG